MTDPQIATTNPTDPRIEVVATEDWYTQESYFSIRLLLHNMEPIELSGGELEGLSGIAAPAYQRFNDLVDVEQIELAPWSAANERFKKEQS